MANDASIIRTPNGDEFVVEIWKPSWADSIDLWDGFLLWLWSLVSPGWRINVKRFPVRGRKAIYRERAPSWEAAQQRLEAISTELERTGSLPAARDV